MTDVDERSASGIPEDAGGSAPVAPPPLGERSEAADGTADEPLNSSEERIADG